MTDQVKKIPYDILRLTKVLTLQNCNLHYMLLPSYFALFKFGFEEFANKMALRTGGLSGVEN
jgi:phenylalanine-4-hydroxylase